MKQRSTTPVSTGFAAKAVLVGAAILMVMAAPLSMSRPAHADVYDQQKAAIQAQINQYQAQANQLSTQLTSLQAQLDALTAQKNEILAQLQLTQVQYNQLTDQIAATKQKILDNQNGLGKILASMYVDGQTTPLEMLASSQSIGDFVDQQAYKGSMSDQLNATIKQVQQLKTKLESDQQKVGEVLNRQKAQEASLAAKEAQQAQLVAETQNQESQYQQLVAQSQQKLQSVSDQQQAYYQSLLRSSGGGGSGVVGSFQYTNWSGNMGCSGGYPYCGSHDSSVDPWGLYNRECVSYVAWALSAKYGKYVGNFNGQGNAQDWPYSAPAYSGAVRVSDPQPGDAVILPANGNFAPIGHAMIVDSVSGGWIHVSQYNFYGTGEYSTMDIRNSGIILLRFPNK